VENNQEKSYSTTASPARIKSVAGSMLSVLSVFKWCDGELCGGKMQKISKYDCQSLKTSDIVKFCH
jgi:hypothetical protein